MLLEQTSVINIDSIFPLTPRTSSSSHNSSHLRFRVLRATDFKTFEKTHTALINIKYFE